MFGGQEWIVVLLIVLLLFGSARLPKLARSMREAKDEFNKSKDPAPLAEETPPPDAADKTS